MKSLWPMTDFMFPKIILAAKNGLYPWRCFLTAVSPLFVVIRMTSLTLPHCFSFGGGVLRLNKEWPYLFIYLFIYLFT